MFEIIVHKINIRFLKFPCAFVTDVNRDSNVLTEIYKAYWMITVVLHWLLNSLYILSAHKFTLSFHDTMQGEDYL